jgi:hypothetical protein
MRLLCEKAEPPRAFGGRFGWGPTGCFPPSTHRLSPPHRVFLSTAALHGERQIVVGHLNFKATGRRLLGADDVATRAPEAPTNDGVIHTRHIPNAVPPDVTDKSQNVAESLRLVGRRVLFHGTDGICYAGDSSVWLGAGGHTGWGLRIDDRECQAHRCAQVGTIEVGTRRSRAEDPREHGS